MHEKPWLFFDLCRDNKVEDLRLRQIEVEADDPGSGDHHFADKGVRKLEDVLDIAMLGLGQGAGLASL